MDGPVLFLTCPSCPTVYWGCLLVKNSFLNISEVNRQCLNSLGTRPGDDFEKVSSTSAHADDRQVTTLWWMRWLIFQWLAGTSVTPWMWSGTMSRPKFRVLNSQTSQQSLCMRVETVCYVRVWQFLWIIQCQYKSIMYDGIVRGLLNNRNCSHHLLSVAI